MLECGARSSIRHAQSVKSSRRTLHSAFWINGALELESCIFPPQVETNRCANQHNSGRLIRKKTQDFVTAIRSACEGAYLDFLYPPQTLATVRTINWEKWEKRNARRLPKGFVHARGYASRAADLSVDVSKQGAGQEYGIDDRTSDDGAFYTPFDAKRVAPPAFSHTSRYEERGNGNARTSNDRSISYRPLPARIESYKPSSERIESYTPLSRRTAAHSSFSERTKLHTPFSERTEAHSSSSERIEAHTPFPERIESQTPFSERTESHTPFTEFKDTAYPVFPGTSRLQTTREQAPITSLYTQVGQTGEESALSDYQDEYFHESTAETDKPIDQSIVEQVSSDDLFIDQRDKGTTLHNFLQWVGDQPDGVQIHHIERAWDLYLTMDPQHIFTNTLEKLLNFFASSSLKIGEDKAVEMYSRLQDEFKTLKMYGIICEVFRRTGLVGIAEQTHDEALARFDGTQELSTVFMLWAVGRFDWDMAYRIKQKMDSNAEGFSRVVLSKQITQAIVQRRKIMEQGIMLVKHLRQLHRTNALSDGFQDFSLEILQAITSQYLQNQLTVLKPDNTIVHTQLSYISTMTCSWLSKERATAYLQSTLESICRPESHVDFFRAQPYVKKLFEALIDRIVPSAEFLKLLLTRTIRECRERAFSPSSLQLNIFGTDKVPYLVKYWTDHHGSVPETFTADLMRYYAVMDDMPNLQQASLEFNKISPKSVDWEETMAAHIEIHSRRGRIPEMIAAFNDISARSGNGQVSNVRCWYQLIQGYKRKSKIGSAIKVLQALWQQGTSKPDVKPLSPILDSLSRKGELDRMEQLIAEYHHHGGVESIQIWQHVIVAHIVKKDISTATSIFFEHFLPLVEEGKYEGEIVKNLNQLMRAEAESSGIDLTLHIFNAMHKQRVAPDASTYVYLMRACVMSRDFDRAEEVMFKVMPDAGLRSDTRHYNVLLQGRASLGHWQNAMILLRKARQHRIAPNRIFDAVALRIQKGFAERQSMKDRPESQAEDFQPQQRSVKSQQKSFQNDSQLTVDILAQPFAQRISEASKDDVLSRLEQLGRMTITGVTQEAQIVEAQLLEQFTQLEKSTNNEDTLELLASMISMYSYQDRHEYVDRCWKIAVRCADQIREQQERRKDQVVQRDLLNKHLSRTTISLQKRNNGKGIVSALSEVMSKGYTVDQRNWNTIVSSLSRLQPPLALLAWQLAERYLIPTWRHWKATFMDQWRVSRTRGYLSRQERLRLMEAANHAQRSKRVRHTTLSALRRAYNEVRNSSVQENLDPNDALSKYVGIPALLQKHAPKTYKIISHRKHGVENYRNRWRRVIKRTGLVDARKSLTTADEQSDEQSDEHSDEYSDVQSDRMK